MRSENAEDHYSYYNLTWWRDPSSVHRARIDNMYVLPKKKKIHVCDVNRRSSCKFYSSVGLRPPPYDFSCAPPLLQALYHIPLFRTAIITRRPPPSDWGSPKNYWRGAGRGIPDSQIPAVEEAPPDYEQIDQEVTTDVDQLSLERRPSQDTRDKTYDSDSDGFSATDMAEETAYYVARKAANLKGICKLKIRPLALLQYNYNRFVSHFSCSRITAFIRLSTLHQPPLCERNKCDSSSSSKR
jgi:hypothetical protein